MVFIDDEGERGIVSLEVIASSLQMLLLTCCGPPVLIYLGSTGPQMLGAHLDRAHLVRPHLVHLVRPHLVHLVRPHLVRPHLVLVRPNLVHLDRPHLDHLVRPHLVRAHLVLVRAHLDHLKPADASSQVK